MRLIALLLILPALLAAQAQHTGTHTFEVMQPPSGTSRPPTCSPPQFFIDTDEPASQQLYVCTASNTWTLQGGSSALKFSKVSSTDANTTNDASTATLASFTIPANTLAVGDFCVMYAQLNYVDDGDTTGLWVTALTINGTNTVSNNLTKGAAWANNDATLGLEARFSIHSTTLAEFDGRGATDNDFEGADSVQGTRTIDTTATMTVYVQKGNSGTSDSGDVIHLRHYSLQCWGNTP